MPAVPALLPDDENARLAMLRQYDILDTAPEPMFDDLTQIAAHICNVPISLISLVDESRQWFKSRVGIDVIEAHCALAFCAHTILQNDVFVVPDALEDSRFAANPLVASTPAIRFYAGASLIAPDGSAIGTLCVLDRVPHTITVEQKQALKILARQVVGQLELRRHTSELETLAGTDSLTGLKNLRLFRKRLKEEFQRASRDSTPLSLILVDVDNFKSYNDIFGHPAGDTVLKQVAAVLQENARTTDVVARYGGEELVLLLPNTDRHAALHAAERLRIAIEEAHWPERTMTASFGIATLTSDIPTETALLVEAEKALYASKQRGRNCVTHTDGSKDILKTQTILELKRFVTQQAPLHDVMSPLRLIRSSTDELAQAYDATIEGWSRILDLRDKETEGHSERVTVMSVRLAQKLGLSEREVAFIRWGALLHDIGKMGVPDSILLKPGPLTEDEWVIMRRHPMYAYEMLRPIGFLRGALDIPHCHHEKWDGSGYPRGLKAEEIPIAARIFAVVDVWDALRSDRPYRKGWPEDRVIAHIREQIGSHFDTVVAEAFLELRAEMEDAELARCA